MRGFQVMIDRDLAELYTVSTKALNQAVKRNIERFPEDFMFQLTQIEKNELVTICDPLQELKYSSQYWFRQFFTGNVPACLFKSKKNSIL